MLSMENLREVVRLGADLSAEKDKNRLFEKLLRTAMEITQCDAGTLYLYQEGALYFKVMKTRSLGISRGERGEKIDLPPVALKEENVCAYAALRRELVNIPDVYSSDRFDFSGPRRYDALTGYRTGSMLVVPLEDAEIGLIGVLQLINKMDADGSLLAFSEEDEFILQSMGSMTAVSLSNMLYVNEIKAQMFSFVQAFATAVDERTPYNGTHTRKVTIYADLLAGEINRRHDREGGNEFFDDARREQLILSAALHDIGKMIVPLTVMNKATRLDEKLETIKARFAWLSVCFERDRFSGRITPEEEREKQHQLKEDLSFIEEKNVAGFLPDDALERVRSIAEKRYLSPDGSCVPYLNEDETECLMIRKGTLTAEERRIMESHVVFTDRILEKVRFSPKYAHTRQFAAGHHEYLNGRGYPKGLSADSLPLESRILTVVDVFDALTCTDRPYKKPIPRPKAFAILHDMARAGQIEEELVSCLETALEEIDMEEIERLAKSDTWGEQIFG